MLKVIQRGLVVVVARKKLYQNNREDFIFKDRNIFTWSLQIFPYKIIIQIMIYPILCHCFRKLEKWENKMAEVIPWYITFQFGHWIVVILMTIYYQISHWYWKRDWSLLVISSFMVIWIFIRVIENAKWSLRI